ncbi:hypothetical protein [Aromatoleum sp.]|uniref:hypothetical protein n=1 Tax=Aromatoleum sp. TaxID=2307007 RepID=UPI002FC9B943
MPKAAFFSSPGLWDKLRGVQPAYRVASVWKLVAYGEALSAEVRAAGGDASTRPEEGSRILAAILNSRVPVGLHRGA